MQITEFTDYRAFLRAVVQESKTANSKYSIAYFSKRMGMSESYLKHVLAGRRSLQTPQAVALAKTLKLSELASTYFLTLVLLEGAPGPESHGYLKKVLASLREASQLEYLFEENSLWLFQDSLSWEIYTLSSTQNFSPDPKSIQKKLFQTASLPQIKKTLHSLVQKNLLVPLEDGTLKAKNVILPDNVNLRGVYSTALRRGLTHLNSAHEIQGRFDAFCMIIDETAFNAISEILAQAKLRMADVVKNNPHKSRIAYFLSGLFWASKPE